MQFNPGMSEQQAKTKAHELYKNTKGHKCKQQNDQKKNDQVVGNELPSEKRPNNKQKWVDGSESEMFNKLEEIARSEFPKTPVLGSRITETLEPQNVNDDVIKYILTRVFKLD